MEIKIQISDAVYAQLLSGTKRVQGSIAMVNAKEGNFIFIKTKLDAEDVMKRLKSEKGILVF